MILRKLTAAVILLLGTTSMWGQTWSQIDKIVASDRQPGDHFSSASQASYGVSIYGDYAIAGAPNDDHSGFQDAGSAYVYRRDANCNWVQMQKLVAPIPNTSDYFGYAVAIFGNFIVVSGRNDDEDENELNTMSGSGSAYIFENISGVWTFTQKIVASDREVGGAFGHDLDITARRIIVGAWGDDQGGGVPYSINSGAAYIFRYNGATWTEVQKLTASDRSDHDWFGVSVAISGEYAIVGAHQEDEDAAGLNTMTSSGSAYMFEFNGSSWSQVDKITSSDRGANEYFGLAVDIDFDRAIVGARSDAQDENGANSMTAAGSAFVFKRDPGSGMWLPEDKLDASDRASGDRFGYSVGISGSLAIVGAALEDHNATGGATLSGAGSAYTFQLSGSAWNQTQKIVANDRNTYDWFGGSSAIFKDRIIVGASDEDEDDSPVPGNTMAESGSAYVYEIAQTPATQPTISASSTTFCPGTTITLSVSSGSLNNAANWQWYTGSCNGTIVGTGNSINVTPGTTTTYYVNGVGGCVSPGPCGSITLTVAPEQWHQTTENTQGNDITNDVITDNNGNVYVCGSYFEKTTLNGGGNPDIIISTGVGPQWGSYVAMYDGCGNLKWEAHTTGSKDNYGNSITLDESNGVVYVAGDYVSNLQFVSGACTPSGAIFATGANRGYVAAFNMSNGCPLSLDPVIEDTYTSLSAITINEGNGDIFVGGHATPNTGGTIYRSFVHKYTPGGGGIGGIVANIASSNMGTFNNKVNDLDFDENNQWLWGIGDFETEIEFFPGFGPFTVIIPGTTAQDAYLITYEDAGGALNPILNRRGNAQIFMSGEGISVDPYTGNPYFTGTYRDAVNTPFQFGTVNNLPGSAGFSGYMIGFDLSGGAGWSRFATVPTSHAYGSSVSCDGNYIYFSGNFNRDNIDIQAVGSFPYTVSGVALPNNHVYLACYEDNGTGVWGNVTEDPSSNTAVHESMSIRGDGNGNVYTVGRYHEKMDYFFSSGTPVLVSSGAGDNGFILHADQSNGDLFKTAGEDVSTQAFEGDFTVYPNPTTGRISGVLESYDVNRNYTLTVWNSLGQRLGEFKLISEQINVDLSAYDNGLYLIRVSDGETVQSVKVIKTR